MHSATFEQGLKRFLISDSTNKHHGGQCGDCFQDINGKETANYHTEFARNNGFEIISHIQIPNDVKILERVGDGTSWRWNELAMDRVGDGTSCL